MRKLMGPETWVFPKMEEEERLKQEPTTKLSKRRLIVVVTIIVSIALCRNLMSTTVPALPNERGERRLCSHNLRQ